MYFEWCFGTFVPCFGGQKTVREPETPMHGQYHNPDSVGLQWTCLHEHTLGNLRTRSVRRASGLVQTGLPESGPNRSRADGQVSGNPTYRPLFRPINVQPQLDSPLPKGEQRCWGDRQSLVPAAHEQSAEEIDAEPAGHCLPDFHTRC